MFEFGFGRDVRLAVTDKDSLFLDELVGGDDEVLGGGTTTDAAGGVVVGAVAGAEPAAVVALAPEGDAAQVGAHAFQHQPLRLLHSHGIRLGVRQGRHVHLVGGINLWNHVKDSSSFGEREIQR